MTRAKPFNSRRRVVDVLADACEPIEAVEISRLCGLTLQSTKGALSTALKANLIHVPFMRGCRGGKRRYYVHGEKPATPDERVDPLETLRRMQEAARDAGRIKK